jgi:hypothetical protein
MSLLRADLRVLGNLAMRRAGRRLAFGTVVGLLLLGTLSWWFAAALLESRHLLGMVQAHRGNPAVGLLGYGVLAGPVVATWLGLALAQRQLFDAPELPLWRLAPLPATRPAMQVLLRAVFVSTCWALALGGPFLAVVMLRLHAPWWALALVPLAMLGATAPLLSLLLSLHVVLVRAFAGRWLRLLFAALGALGSVAFSSWLLLSVFARGDQRARDLAAVAAAPRELPWTVDASAAVLAAASRGEFEPRAVLALAGWLGVAFLLFRLAARLHPGACERHLAAEPLPWRTRGRRWPTGIAAVVRRKEFAQLLQQPSALIGFLVFALLVFALARERALLGRLLEDPRLPAFVSQVAAMSAHWFLAVLLVLYSHMGRLVLWDASQWSLWVAAPCPPGPILRGKLQAVFALLLWPLLLVAAAGALLLEAGPLALLAFGGIALGGTGTAIGVLAIVGTLPRLLRPGDGPVAQGGRGLLAALLLVVGFELAAAPALVGWAMLAEHSRHQPLTTAAALAGAPWVVGAALAYGALIAALGIWLGSRNLGVLLRPR